VDNFPSDTTPIISEKTVVFKVFSGCRFQPFLQFIHSPPADAAKVIHNILWLMGKRKHKTMWRAGDFRHFSVYLRQNLYEENPGGCGM